MADSDRRSGLGEAREFAAAKVGEFFGQVGERQAPSRRCRTVHWVPFGRSSSSKRHKDWVSLTWFLTLVSAFTFGGCVGKLPSLARSEPISPVEFQYYTGSGKVVSAASLRGRVTAVVFVTTYDAASQIEVLDLQGIVRRHAPRINALVVVVEAPQYAVLLPAYSQSLDLTIPVAIADYATLSGEGPFGELPRVPTLVLLDRDGVERWRAEGSVSGGDIERRVRQLTGDRR